MERFAFSARPVCPNVVYQQDGLRISLLTSRLLRMEKGNSTDLTTQTVWNRDLGKADFSLEHHGGWSPENKASRPQGPSKHFCAGHKPPVSPGAAEAGRVWGPRPGRVLL